MAKHGDVLTARAIVIEFGAIPLSSCLAQIDSTAAIAEVLAELRKHGRHEDGYCYVDVDTLARCLDLSQQHARVLIDLIDSITDAHHLFVIRQQGQSEASAVDAHSVALFLFAQLYIRQATRPEAMDVWPTQSAGLVADSLSPFGGAHSTHGMLPVSGGAASPSSQNFFNAFNSPSTSGSAGPPSPLGVDFHPRVAGHLHAASSSFGSPSPHAHNPAPLSHSSLSTLPSLSTAGSHNSDTALPHSPARSNSSNSSAGSAPMPTSSGLLHIQQQKSSPIVRRDLQVHLAQHSALLHGYTDYMRRHAHGLLSLVLDSPLLGVQDGHFSEHKGHITLAEFDRLAFLLKSSRNSGARRSHDSNGSPMDISPSRSSPFSDEGWRLSAAVPSFLDSADSGKASFSEVAEWLSHSISQDIVPIDAFLPSSGMDSNTLPPTGVVQGSEVDIQGVVKSTIVKGEEDFPSGNMKIIDCHDSVIYALAPLQYAWIFCCSDCTIVVGAVARMLRIERCERLTLIAGAVRIVISSCHDSTFYLGVNRPTLLIGDNRTLQLGPYNTQYERLPVHLAAAGITPETNVWDQYIVFARNSTKASSPDSHAHPGGASGMGSQSRPACQLLPPEKLLPFMIPFQGGRGAMCGGAASNVTRLAADLGSFVGLGESETPKASNSRAAAMVPGPFVLPPAYQEAKEQKVQAVTDLRHHIKSTVLDEGKKRELQSTIQAYFKDWLTSTGKMREIYDLARMEREEGSSPRSPHNSHSHPFS